MKRGRRNLGLDYRALYERYLAGESGTTLATEVGINYTGLYRYWQRRGWPRRTQTDAKVLLFQQRPELKDHIAAAQEARRGAVDPMARKEQRAKTREARMLGTSPLEDAIAAYLERRGYQFIRQRAIGPYNVDFCLEREGVVIEINGGGHNPRVRANHASRIAFLQERGWRVVEIKRRLAVDIAAGLRNDWNPI